MTGRASPREASLPAVGRVLETATLRALAARHGRMVAKAAVRQALSELRRELGKGQAAAAATLPENVAERAARCMEQAARPSLVPVFNLTGTLLHTNLGRAPLPREAIEALIAAAALPSNLEYDLSKGARGDRDAHVAALIRELTGAEAATVVNNNAAALLLALNTLARGKEVVVSRGELIEIGDSFRLPEIMSRAGCRLREVGTTNRTRLADYAEAIGPRTALLVKVPPSNFRIEGFAASVGVRELAGLAAERGLPLLVDLGSGALVDLERFGIAREPTVAATLDAGADLVTFSGDKLLGGPQAGLLVGRAPLVSRLKRNPLRRALRPGKLTIAALAALLRLYRDPDRLAERLPALRLMTRPLAEIEEVARRLEPAVATILSALAEVSVEPALSEFGSGALPADGLPSVALVLRPLGGRRGKGARLAGLAAAFRALPRPVIGRIRENALWFDLRGLDDEAAFQAQLDRLPEILRRTA